MKQLINDFLVALTADGKSKCTIKAYNSDLQAFCLSLLAGKKSLSTLRYADLRDWANGLEKSGLSASSRARKISAVKSFLKYLVKMEVINQNPADGLNLPKLEKKAPKVISIDEAGNILNNASKGPKCAANGAKKSNPVWFRDYAILATFLFTGVRREELTNIKLTDVNLPEQKMLIHGKGNKQRTVYLNDSLCAILSEYILAHRGVTKTAKDSPYLFVSIKNAKLATRTINDIVDKALIAADIKERGVGPHILRKRFATSCFLGTGDIATTSKMLGHSSPTVTMRYVVIDEQNMRKAVDAINF